MAKTTYGHLFYRPGSAVRGRQILPLNELRRTYRELYELHRSKYVSTPEVLAEAVPPLGCTWGDVVFLSPLHPAPLFAALGRAGRIMPDGEPWILPAARLDPERTVIRLMRAGASGHHPDPPDTDDYLPFTTASLRAINRVTLTAVERLESLKPGDPWLPWVDVPHVLHRGSIPVDWFSSGPAKARQCESEHPPRLGGPAAQAGAPTPQR